MDNNVRPACCGDVSDLWWDRAKDHFVWWLGRRLQYDSKSRIELAAYLEEETAENTKEPPLIAQARRLALRQGITISRSELNTVLQRSMRRAEKDINRLA